MPQVETVTKNPLLKAVLEVEDTDALGEPLRSLVNKWREIALKAAKYREAIEAAQEQYTLSIGAQHVLEDMIADSVQEAPPETPSEDDEDEEDEASRARAEADARETGARARDGKPVVPIRRSH